MLALIDYITDTQMTEIMSIAHMSPHSTTRPPKASLPIGTVQTEWDTTIRRIREAVEVTSWRDRVDTLGVAGVEFRKGGDVAAVERILFDNLLFAPLLRSESEHTIRITGDWLWTWRKAVPWTVNDSSRMSRLVPDAPSRMFSYRYNVVELE